MLGLFDSGIGGLTVVRELLRRHPSASFVYLGDTARAPYGNKSPDAIRRYALEDAKFLVDRGARHIAVACNTVSSVALDELRQAFPSVKFFDVVTPAVNSVVRAAGLPLWPAAISPSARGRVKTVGVIGTRATIQSDIYARRLHVLDPKMSVLSVACPLFAPLVEEGWARRPETQRIVRRCLAPLRQKQIDALILGCTHYPWLHKAICASLQRRVRIINSAAALIDQIDREEPSVLGAQAEPQQDYFFTDLSSHTAELARKWVGQAIDVQTAASA